METATGSLNTQCKNDAKNMRWFESHSEEVDYLSFKIYFLLFTGSTFLLKVISLFLVLYIPQLITPFFNKLSQRSVSLPQEAINVIIIFLKAAITQ